MSDRAALYAAVCANPDEDAVRLAMADWFDENGHAKRAAFVRARVAYDRDSEAETAAAAFHRHARGECGAELERVDWAACDPAVAALSAARATTLRHRFNVTPKTEEVPRLHGVSFVGDGRGFLDGVSVADGETFARNADAIFRAAPVTAVRIGEFDADGARAVVASGYLGRIRNLDVQFSNDAAGVRVIGRHADAGGIRGLGLDGADDPEGLLSALGDGEHWTGLRSLDLIDLDESSGDSPATDQNLAGVLRRKPFRGLERLIAWGNGLGDETARAVASGKFTALRHLDLGINWVTSAGAEALAHSKHLPALQHLDLGSNEVRDGEAVAALVASPHLPSLTVLRLDSNRFRGPKAFPAKSRGPSLRLLQLDGCSLSGAGAEQLFRCPALAGLWFLDVGSCDVTDRGAAALAAADLPRLASLNLSGNNLTAAGVAAVARSPLAARLQWLNVSGMAFGGAGITALVNAAGLQAVRCLIANGRGLTRLRAHFGKKVVVSA